MRSFDPKPHPLRIDADERRIVAERCHLGLYRGARKANRRRPEVTGLVHGDHGTVRAFVWHSGADRGWTAMTGHPTEVLPLLSLAVGDIRKDQPN